MTATLDEHGANQHGWGSFFHGPGEENPSRPIGFRVCDRRFPLLWSGPGQRGGRWNREGEAPIHYLQGRGRGGRSAA
jgi:hypothetical protein